MADRIGDLLSSPRSRTVTVPRWAGLGRLGEVPPVNRALDRLLSADADRIRRLAARTVARRMG